MDNYIEKLERFHGYTDEEYEELNVDLLPQIKDNHRDLLFYIKKYLTLPPLKEQAD